MKVGGQLNGTVPSPEDVHRHNGRRNVPESPGRGRARDLNGTAAAALDTLSRI
ncbi:MAG: hypothetical protein HYU37_16010 [Acidobacteria bacterium]|nr:hypothetical protein [Acidobacteriota bacterium]